MMKKPFLSIGSDQTDLQNGIDHSHTDNDPKVCSTVVSSIKSDVVSQRTVFSQRNTLQAQVNSWKAICRRTMCWQKLGEVWEDESRLWEANDAENWSS